MVKTEQNKTSETNPSKWKTCQTKHEKNIYKHPIFMVHWLPIHQKSMIYPPLRPCVLGFPDRPHPLSNQYPGNVLEVGSPRGEGQGNSWGPVFKELWTIIVPLIIIRPYFLSRGGCLFTPINLNDLTDRWNWWNISASYFFWCLKDQLVS